MSNIALPIVLLSVQIILILLFGLFMNYDTSVEGDMRKEKKYNWYQATVNNYTGFNNNTNLTFQYYFYPSSFEHLKGNVLGEYSVFQHIHIMVFVGFGFLMIFLKRYGYSSLTFSMILGALAIQWALLVHGWIFEIKSGRIILSMNMLIKAEYAATSVLLSFGVVLGKLNLLQLLFMALIEVVLFNFNEFICFTIFKASDAGYSMLVHVFGTYFGIMVALFTARPGDVQSQSYKELSVYHSDLLTMIGTIFLWLFWPSFNSALVPMGDHFRAIVNTYFALTSSTIVAAAVSTLVQKNRRFTMIHIQNATLAGGVAIGTMVNMIIYPWVSFLIGFLAGAISVIGYQYITPCFNQKLRIHDTRGVHNVHGIPGLMSAIGSIICIATANQEAYGTNFYRIFPTLREISALSQALYQLASLALILGIAIAGGIVTGFLLRLPFWKQPKNAEIMDDWDYWVLPSDGYPLIPNHINAPPIYKHSEKDVSVLNNP